MKQTILTLITLMLAITVFGQRAMETRGAAYAAEAQKTFNLDAAQTAQIKELWLARSAAFREIGNGIKAGSIKPQAKSELQKEVSKEYAEKMMAILGCKRREFSAFNKRAMEQIKK